MGYYLHIVVTVLMTYHNVSEGTNSYVDEMETQELDLIMDFLILF